MLVGSGRVTLGQGMTGQKVLPVEVEVLAEFDELHAAIGVGVHLADDEGVEGAFGGGGRRGRKPAHRPRRPPRANISQMSAEPAGLA
jgi:hypothetical protein